MTRDSLLAIIHTIKSYAEPPEVEGDTYNQREPWDKFGFVSSGICMKWCWFRDDVILEKATEKDILKAAQELRITKYNKKISFEQFEPHIEQCNACLRADWEEENKGVKFYNMHIGGMLIRICEDCARTLSNMIAMSINI